MIDSLASFMKSNYALGSVVANVGGFLTDTNAGDVYVQLKNQLAQIYKKNGVRSIVNRIDMAFFWAAQDKVFNPLATEASFVPGAFGKIPLAFGAATDKSNYLPKPEVKTIKVLNKPITTDISEINFTDNGDNVNLSQYFIIKYYSTEGWKLMRLKATMGSDALEESISNKWDSYDIFGNTQDNYIYKNTSAKIPLSFSDYASNRADMKNLYYNLSELKRLNFGRYHQASYDDSGENNGKNLVYQLDGGIVIYFTIGNLYHDQAAIIENMSFRFDTNLWDNTYQLPMYYDVKMDLTLLYDEVPTNSTVYFKKAIETVDPQKQVIVNSENSIVNPTVIAPKDSYGLF